MVAGVEPKGANNNTIIELLKCFGRTDVLIQEHLTQLLDEAGRRQEAYITSMTTYSKT